MLDNLRGMAVFASVVDQGSFSGSAKELGITTSAVSQQIRALESDLGVVLLHRSTRKLSLTEAGAGYYESAKEVVRAAEKGRIRITQLRDDLSGSLRISTTPELAISHISPALSSWIMSHDDLDMSILADNRQIDLIEERIDIAIKISAGIDDSSVKAHPLADVRQLLVASPDYIESNPPIQNPKDLKNHQLICINRMKDCNQFNFVEPISKKKTKIKMGSRFSTNNILLATDFAKQGHGLVRLMDIDAQKFLNSGELVEVLPNYQLPSHVLYAVTLNREQQPAKVTKCLEVLKKYFKVSQ